MVQRCSFAGMCLAMILFTMPSSSVVAAESASLSEARAVLEGGEPQEAVRLFTEILDDDGISPGDRHAALTNRGMAYIEMGSLKQGLEDLDRAVDLNPDGVEALINRAAAHAQLEQGEQALADLNRVLELDPENYTAHYNRGNLRAAGGTLGLAVADYSEAVRLKPDFHEAFLRMGTAQAAQRNLGDALASLDRAVEIRADPEALFSRASILSGLGQAERALADLNRALEEQPNFVRALHARGYLLGAMGRFEEALRDFDRSIELEPEQGFGFNMRGNAYRAMGNQEKAYSDYAEAARLDPKELQYLVNKANAAISIGRYDDVLAATDAALSVSPEFAGALQLRGRAYFNAGEFADSRVAFQEYSERQPSDPYGALWEYLTALRLGVAADPPRVEDDWVRQIVAMLNGKLDPDEFLEAVDHPDEAVARVRRLEALYYLGQRYLLDGQTKKATDSFEECVSLGLTGHIEHSAAVAELQRSRGQDP